MGVGELLRGEGVCGEERGGVVFVGRWHDGGRGDVVYCGS